MNETIDVRMAKYLAGESGIEEREAFEMEMESSPALRDQFLACQKIWQAKQTNVDPDWNVDSAWNRFNSEKQIEVPEHGKTRVRRFSWAVAAAFVIALGSAIFLWMDRQVTDYAYDESKTGPIVLSDGSKIYLNEGATLRVYSFKKKKREVELHGEAFFEINPDAKKPFIVEAGNTITEVVGTMFNIEESADITSIFVKSGKVIFRSLKNEEIAVALTSGEAAIYQDDKIKSVANPSPNMQAWHVKELQFKEMALADVINDLSSYFHQEISIENENVKKCRVTFSLPFKDPELKSVLEAVTLSVNASYAMEGTRCIIKGGNNCL